MDESEEELEELCYPTIEERVGEQRTLLRELHEQIQQAGGAEASSVTLDLLAWAEQLVLSRAFMSSIDGGDKSVLEGKMGSKEKRPVEKKKKDEKNAIQEAWERSDLKAKIDTDLPNIAGHAEKAGNIAKNAAGLLPNIGGVSGLGGGDDEELCMAMMPMMDSYNHFSGSQNGCRFDPETNCYVLTAAKALRAGDEALISYGPKTNDELLQLFGFIEKGNIYDIVVAHDLPAYATGFALKKLRNDQEELRRRIDKIEIAEVGPCLGAAELSADGAPRGMWHALRILLCTPEEFLGAMTQLDRPASFATEERCFDLMRSYVKEVMKAMGGPISNDMRIIRDSSSPPRLQIAAKFRAEKKRILSEFENTLKMAETASRGKKKVVRFHIKR